MPVTKARKEEVLKSLEEKFSKAKSVYFSKNSGLEVNDINDLRKKLKKEGIDLMVAKKTLIQLAAKKNGVAEIPADVMDGPITAAFSYKDEVAPAKILHTFAKDHEALELMGGVVAGKLMNKAEAKQMATLPSREELLAKLVGSMKSPISGFHGVLAGTLRKLVYAVKAVHDKKASGAPAPAAAAPVEAPAAPAPAAA